jgi:hypothetical protein
MNNLKKLHKDIVSFMAHPFQALTGNCAAPTCGLGITENKISLAPARIKPLFLCCPVHSLH